MTSRLPLGADYLEGDRCSFCVWAPFVETVSVHFVGTEGKYETLNRDSLGYHSGIVSGIEPGALYTYRLDGKEERPDPASRFQPEGVHGPSQVLRTAFPWGDEGWSGISLSDFLVYELHVGTYTPEGTFDAVVAFIGELKELGVTAIELMPVAQFPGERNWGYDGAYPYAVQNSYGGPEGLKRLVNACHSAGLAVVLDVVYNHLGPEGNYLHDFGPYFTDRYKTPWGAAVNFDGPWSDQVRRFFIDNALYWVREFHIDALRIDAVHAIIDFSARTFLEELGAAIHRQAETSKRRIYVIPESALNDSRIIKTQDEGGFGLDAQWNDDFHHALHALLTGERTGYYRDFGRLEDLAKAFREGYVYTGQYSSYRVRRHGNSSRSIPARCFVVFSQNHDQVGNRMLGERLSRLVDFERLKLAAGVVLLSPFIPLLFMGEEWGEDAAFQYFISHSDPELVKAVRTGRAREFEDFAWQGTPPDPQDNRTFSGAKIDHRLSRTGRHAVLFAFYRELIRLRQTHPVLRRLSKERMDVHCSEPNRILAVRRWDRSGETLAFFHFGVETVPPTLSLPKGRWKRLLDSSEECWDGPGSSSPQVLESTGALDLDLPPWGVILFGR